MLWVCPPQVSVFSVQIVGNQELFKSARSIKPASKSDSNTVDQKVNLESRNFDNLESDQPGSSGTAI